MPEKPSNIDCPPFRKAEKTNCKVGSDNKRQCSVKCVEKWGAFASFPKTSEVSSLLPKRTRIGIDLNLSKPGAGWGVPPTKRSGIESNQNLGSSLFGAKEKFIPKTHDNRSTRIKFMLPHSKVSSRKLVFSNDNSSKQSISMGDKIGFDGLFLSHWAQPKKSKMDSNQNWGKRMAISNPPLRSFELTLLDTQDEQSCCCPHPSSPSTDTHCLVCRRYIDPWRFLPRMPVQHQHCSTSFGESGLPTPIEEMHTAANPSDKLSRPTNRPEKSHHLPRSFKDNVDPQPSSSTSPWEEVFSQPNCFDSRSHPRLGQGNDVPEIAGSTIDEPCWENVFEGLDRSTNQTSISFRNPSES